VAGVLARGPGLASFVPSSRKIHACSHNFEMGLGRWRKGDTDGDRQEPHGGIDADGTKSISRVADARDLFPR
jgi:hypothetical protein